jgi:hypothetical protein
MNMQKLNETEIDRVDSVARSRTAAPAEAELSQELMETQVRNILATNLLW